MIHQHNNTVIAAESYRTLVRCKWRVSAGGAGIDLLPRGMFYSPKNIGAGHKEKWETREFSKLLQANGLHVFFSTS